MNLYRVLPALAALTLVLASCSGPKPSFTLADMPGDGLYAELVTDKGSFLIQLEFEKAPLTVINFVSLAQGTRKTNRPDGIPFYDGLTFHRVDPKFVIQGGCPNGNGSGNAGYQFPDEFHPDLRHDAAGVVSMANAQWPDTNGSQFMILRSPAKHLDDLHSVFGKVVKGLEIANSIAANDRIYKVAIFRVGAVAEAFKTDQNAFIAAQTAIIEARKKVEAQKQIALTEKFLKEWPEAKVTESGLIIKVNEPGAGEPSKAGDVVAVHAILKMVGDREFDNSYDRKLPHVFELGKGKVIPGWDEGMHGMLPGEKRSLVVPPDLAYGAEGKRGLVLPYQTIYLDLELIEINPPPEKYAPPKKKAPAPSAGPPPPPSDPAPVETPVPPTDTPAPEVETEPAAAEAAPAAETPAPPAPPTPPATPEP